MARPPSTTRDPIAHWRAGVKADAALPAEVRRHLLSVGGQVWADVEGTGVVHRATAAVWLATYARALQRPPDMLTQARALSELVRAARSLGLLAALDRTRGGLAVRRKRSPFSAPPERRGVFTAPARAPAAMRPPEDDDSDEAEGDEPEDEGDDE